MSLDVPTVKQLIDRQQSDIEASLGVDPRIARGSLIRRLIEAHSGVVYGLYGHINSRSKNMVPWSAVGADLDRFAEWLGRGMNRRMAAAANGLVTFTGSDGSVIPAGTILQRADGAEYATDTEASIVSGSVDIAVTASNGGLDSSALPSVTLQLTSPITGVQSSAVVGINGLTGGSDTESDEELRTRLSARIKQTSQGGAHADYEQWAFEVEGVTRVWVFPQWVGPGTVGVFFVRDNDVGLIPDAGEVQTVQDYLDSRRPVTASVTVAAPTEALQDMTIALSPNTAAVQAAVQSSLQDLFYRGGNVEDGTGSGTVLLSHIRQAISGAAGEIDHNLVSPTADIIINNGELAGLGTITWQSL